MFAVFFMCFRDKKIVTKEPGFYWQVLTFFISGDIV